jgi:hypothetical protein
VNKQKREACVRQFGILEMRKINLRINKKTIVYWIVVAVIINVIYFCIAYPETLKPEPNSLARDFSAYYIGAWRLFHNPTQIYSGMAQPGDYQILPQAQTFKYTPSSLILFAPFLLLSYPNAMIIFSFLQLALLPLLAFFVYKLTKDKNPIIGSIVAVIILIEPLPVPPLFSSTMGLLKYGTVGLNLPSLAPSYFIGYVVVNAHILQTILLVGAFYFASDKKPWFSALLFAFSAFDPRASIFALPLLLWYSRQKIKQFISGSAIILTVTNIPFFLYYNIGLTFLANGISGDIASQMYSYDWLPLYVVLALTVMEIFTYGSAKTAEQTGKFNRR